VRRFDDAGGGRRHREAGPAPAPARRARPRLKRPMSGRPGTKKPRTGGAFRSSGGTAVSVAHLLLQVLPALLRINGALGGQARLEAVKADLFAGIDAEAVITRVDTLERAVDLADQLAVAVAGPQFQRVLGLAGGALGLVANVTNLFLQVLDRLLGFFDQVRTPLHQPLAEVLQLQRAHVFLVRTRPITIGHDHA